MNCLEALMLRAIVVLTCLIVLTHLLFWINSSRHFLGCAKLVVIK